MSDLSISHDNRVYFCFPDTRSPFRNEHIVRLVVSHVCQAPHWRFSSISEKSHLKYQGWMGTFLQSPHCQTETLSNVTTKKWIGKKILLSGPG